MDRTPRAPSSPPHRNLGFPPLVRGGLGLLTLFFLTSSILTTDRIVLLGRNTDGRIAELAPRRRITWVTVEYSVDGATVRSSRGAFNEAELADLAQRVGRYEPGRAFEPGTLIGAAVPVRYARGRPELAHIRGFVPMYREFLTAQAAWMVCAGLWWLTGRRHPSR